MAPSLRIFLDYAAGAPLRPAAREAMMAALEAFGNPSSVHTEGQRARHLLDEARRDVAECLGVRAERVVFTSGGTEANNLALKGVGGRILVSAVEHDCVLQTAAQLDFGVIPVDGNGVVRLEVLREELAKGDVRLVSVMHANNETGVIQPIVEIAALTHEFGALCHTDAVQTVGHIPLDFQALGVDLLTLSSHKFGGPRGAGALIVKPEVKMEALLHGGAQERNRRAGTENVAGYLGMAAALQESLTKMDMERALARQMAALMDGMDVVAKGAEKVDHVRLLLAKKNGSDVVIGLDLAGVAVSQGSACSSGQVKESHVLAAMGFPAGNGVRCSWGWDSKVSDIDILSAALEKVL